MCLHMRQGMESRYANWPATRNVHSANGLNSYHPFPEIFPAEWREGASDPSPPDCSYGCWGQMIARTGGVHWKNEKRLRRTGWFPSECVACARSVTQLRGHLSRAAFGR